jgi:hypothetical protein
MYTGVVIDESFVSAERESASALIAAGLVGCTDAGRPFAKPFTTPDLATPCGQSAE